MQIMLLSSLQEFSFLQHNTKFFVIFKYDYESDLAACNQWNSFAGKVWVRRSVSVGNYFFTGRLSENSLGKFLKRFKSLEILKALEGGKICIFPFSILQRQKKVHVPIYFWSLHCASFQQFFEREEDVRYFKDLIESILFRAFFIKMPTVFCK